MFGAVLKATNSSFQKGMLFCRSKYVKKVMKLLAFIFEQPSYLIVSIPDLCLLSYFESIVRGYINYKAIKIFHGNINCKAYVS